MIQPSVDKHQLVFGEFSFSFVTTEQPRVSVQIYDDLFERCPAQLVDDLSCLLAVALVGRTLISLLLISRALVDLVLISHILTDLVVVRHVVQRSSTSL